MIDHRSLQRTLFRMQADPAFAAAILERRTAAIESTGLGEEELGLLDGVDPAALAADPGGRRRTQITGNAASEYQLSLAYASRRERGGSLLSGFLSSEEFHRTMAEDGRLPLAFGQFAKRLAEEAGDPAGMALAELELAMATLRRATQEHLSSGEDPAADLAATELRLSPLARVHGFPKGTLELAEAVSALFSAEPAPAGGTQQLPVVTTSQTECLLLRAERPASVHQLANISPERLQPPVDELLTRSREAFGVAARAAFAREQGAEPEALEGFLEGFVDDGVLLRGSSA